MEAHQIFQIPNNGPLIQTINGFNHQELIQTFNNLQDNFSNTYQGKTKLITLEYSIRIIRRLFRDYGITDEHCKLLEIFMSNTLTYFIIQEEENLPWRLEDINEYRHIHPRFENLDSAAYHDMIYINRLLRFEPEGIQRIIPERGFWHRIVNINRLYY